MNVSRLTLGYRQADLMKFGEVCLLLLILLRFFHFLFRFESSDAFESCDQSFIFLILRLQVVAILLTIGGFNRNPGSLSLWRISQNPLTGYPSLAYCPVASETYRLDLRAYACRAPFCTSFVFTLMNGAGDGERPASINYFPSEKSMRKHNVRAKNITAVFLLALSVTIFAQDNGNSSAEVLTNDKVIAMTKAGLGPGIIVGKIRASTTKFNTSTDELMRLKREGVADTVIEAMLSPSRGLSTITAAPAAGNPNVNATPTSYPLPPDKGAYLWDGKEMHLLYQSTVPSMGQNFWRSMTPFVKKKFELQLIGAHAKAQFDNSQPTLLVSGLQEVIPGIPAYRLLYVKSGGMMKDRRIVGTYDVGGFFGSVRMVDNEIECEVKKVAEMVYAVTPLKPLADGEYGLVQVPKLAEVSSKPTFAPPIWDFGLYVKTSGPPKQ